MATHYLFKSPSPVITDCILREKDDGQAALITVAAIEGVLASGTSHASQLETIRQYINCHKYREQHNGI